MKIEEYFLKHNGKPSITRTAFGIGFVVCLLKLAFSGLGVGSITIAPFTGGDFALAVGALGAIYSLDKKVNGNA